MNNYFPGTALKGFSAPERRSILHEEIFTNAIIRKTHLSEQVRKHLEAFQQRGEVPPVGQNLFALGADIIAALSSGIPLPGVSIPVVYTIAKWWKKFTYRRSSVIRMLSRKAGLMHFAGLQDLMVDWVRYVVDPSDDKLSVLRHRITRTATEETLFKSFCLLLKKSNYSTIVLLFDEVDEIVKQSGLTVGLENLWDTHKDAQKQINIVFVLATSSELADLEDEDTYGGFVRRFVTSEANTVFNLAKPRINKVKSNDDFERAFDFVQGLYDTLTHVERYTPPTEEKNKARRVLNEKNDATWQMLWSAVCGLWVKS